MKLLDTLHRWTGGLIGLVLALLGLSGTILVYKHLWIGIPGAGDPLRGDLITITATTETLMAMPGAKGIIYADESFGLHQLRLGKEAGAYASQSGEVMTRWATQWERPELWIFDFHHYLFADDAGKWVAGIAGIAGILFVITGAILWWRTRKTFQLRLWPKRMSRPSIVMHHRDIGIVAAPLLLISIVTGTMMIFRPFALAVVAPFGPVAETAKALDPPKYKGGLLTGKPDYTAMLTEARRRFPDAQFRILTMPRKPGDPISLRMKQPAEWLPNGRTSIAFDAATGEVLGARDALAMAPGAQAFNMAFPIHASKVGGWTWRILLTISGLAMTMLGSLAVWSFWFKRPKAAKRPAKKKATASA
ncbi:MAG: PepSY domain-containing protein [Sphingopyxis sp.]|nr:PepSY domain-containing protein [Sphingopyxis sp.]